MNLGDSRKSPNIRGIYFHDPPNLAGFNKQELNALH